MHGAFDAPLLHRHAGDNAPDALPYAIAIVLARRRVDRECHRHRFRVISVPAKNGNAAATP